MVIIRDKIYNNNDMFTYIFFFITRWVLFLRYEATEHEKCLKFVE